MKILILVLSYNEGVYADFKEAQMTTWDFWQHPNIDVRYYHGKPRTHAKDIQCNCSDDYEMMHWKLKLALDQIDYHKYDLIFRTNSCSYIHKERLIKVAEKLPKTACYAGYHNGNYISGAGIFFSPDVLDILSKELTDTPHRAEDVLIGEILATKVGMIAENSRIDAGLDGVTNYDSYHFRFKTSNDEKDRPRDINNMIKLHEYFTSQNQ